MVDPQPPSLKSIFILLISHQSWLVKINRKRVKWFIYRENGGRHGGWHGGRYGCEHGGRHGGGHGGWHGGRHGVRHSGEHRSMSSPPSLRRSPAWPMSSPSSPSFFEPKYFQAEAFASPNFLKPKLNPAHASSNLCEFNYSSSVFFSIPCLP